METMTEEINPILYLLKGFEYTAIPGNWSDIPYNIYEAHSEEFKYLDDFRSTRASNKLKDVDDSQFDLWTEKQRYLYLAGLISEIYSSRDKYPDDYHSILIQKNTPALVLSFCESLGFVTGKEKGTTKIKLTINIYRLISVLEKICSLDNTLTMVKKFMNFLLMPNDLNRNYYQFKYNKVDPRAIPPAKARITDSGFDIALISIEPYAKVEGLYIGNTGLAVMPPHGWSFDMVGRSSMVGEGWEFVGNVGVIDREYTGPMKAILRKLDNRPMPTFPFTCLQIKLTPVIHANFTESPLLETSRGDKGFGSTQIKTITPFPYIESK